MFVRVEDVRLGDAVQLRVLVAARDEERAVHQMREAAAEDVVARVHVTGVCVRSPDPRPSRACGRGRVGLRRVVADRVVGEHLAVGHQRDVDADHGPVDERAPLPDDVLGAREVAAAARASAAVAACVRRVRRGSAATSWARRPRRSARPRSTRRGHERGRRRQRDQRRREDDANGRCDTHDPAPVEVDRPTLCAPAPREIPQTSRCALTLGEASLRHRAFARMCAGARTYRRLDPFPRRCSMSGVTCASCSLRGGGAAIFLLAAARPMSAQELAADPLRRRSRPRDRAGAARGHRRRPRQLTRPRCRRAHRGRLRGARRRAPADVRGFADATLDGLEAELSRRLRGPLAGRSARRPARLVVGRPAQRRHRRSAPHPRRLCALARRPRRWRGRAARGRLHPPTRVRQS